MLDPIRAALQRTAATPIQTQQNNFNIEKAKQIFSLLSSSQNPQAILNNLTTNNSALSNIIDLLSQPNGTANLKSIYESLAKQCGQDPVAFLKTLQS